MKKMDPEELENQTTDNSLEDSQQPDPQVQQEEPKGNPAWDPALQSVPEEFHPHLKNHFSEWDKNFQKVQQEFAPYKEFAELKVSSDDLNRGMQLLHILNTNPKGLYDYMGEQYQFAVQQAQNNSQGQQEQQSQQEYDLSDFPEIEKHPKFQEMQQRLETALQQAGNAQNFVQTFQQREMQEAANRQVQQEMDAVKQKFQNIDLAAVGNMAIGMSQQSGKQVSLMEAAEYINSLMPQPRVSDTAPQVIRSGNRGIQQPQKGFGSLSGDDRVNFLAEAMAKMNSND